jgi:hypothetical protein
MCTWTFGPTTATQITANQITRTPTLTHLIRHQPDVLTRSPKEWSHPETLPSTARLQRSKRLRQRTQQRTHTQTNKVSKQITQPRSQLKSPTEPPTVQATKPSDQTTDRDHHQVQYNRRLLPSKELTKTPDDESTNTPTSQLRDYQQNACSCLQQTTNGSC